MIALVVLVLLPSVCHKTAQNRTSFLLVPMTHTITFQMDVVFTEQPCYQRLGWRLNKSAPSWISPVFWRYKCSILQRWTSGFAMSWYGVSDDLYCAAKMASSCSIPRWFGLQGALQSALLKYVKLKIIQLWSKDCPNKSGKLPSALSSWCCFPHSSSETNAALIHFDFRDWQNHYAQNSQRQWGNS